MKKGFLFIFVVIIGASVFAEEQRPATTVSFDAGPVLLGALFQDLAAAFADGAKARVQAQSSGFGLGVLYERRITDNFAVAGRASYFGATTFVRHADMGFSAFAIEGQGRYYPFGGIFFLSGMLGYTQLSAHLHGRNHHDERTTNATPPVRIPALEMSLSENYLTLGANLGWSIDFGSPSGFVFEPSVGYSFPLRIGSGDGFGKADEYAYTPLPPPPAPQNRIHTGAAEKKAMNAMARHLLAGGFRVGLAFGWRF